MLGMRERGRSIKGGVCIIIRNCRHLLAQACLRALTNCPEWWCSDRTRLGCTLLLPVAWFSPTLALLRRTGFLWLSCSFPRESAVLCIGFRCFLTVYWALLIVDTSALVARR